MRLRQLKIILVLAGHAALLFSLFQNCGAGVRLSRIPAASSEPQQFKPSGLICSDTGPSSTTPIRFSFVVDNSLSNVGNEYVRKVAPVGSDTFVHTLGAHIVEAISLGQSGFGNPYFDINPFLATGETLVQFSNKIVVSDQSGKRFAAIKKFLDEPACVSIANGFSYSVHGFANEVHQPLGFGESCESPYVTNPQTFRNQVDGLKKYQDMDLARAKTIAGGPQSVYQLGNTNYRQGLLCTARKMETDAHLNAAEFPFYYTLFLSDGLATDKFDPCAQFYRSTTSYSGDESYYLYPTEAAAFSQCIATNAVPSCYTTGPRCPYDPRDPNFGKCVHDYRTGFSGGGLYRDWTCLNQILIPKIVRNLKTELNSIGVGFRLQPIFYWPKDRETLSDFALANQILQPMAQEGGAASAIRLDSGQEILDLAKQICSKIEANLKTNFTITNYLAVNLTAKLKNGELKADSDMDGILDEDESGTFSPTLSRSTNGVLDGLCQKLGPACATVPTCNATDFKGLGLNDCDVKALDPLTSANVTAVDTDSDTLLDLIELIKGSRMLEADADQLTSTGDNYNIKYVIGRGLDLSVNNVASPTDPSYLMDARFQFQNASAGCGAGREALGITLENIPLVETQSFQDTRTDALSLSHVLNENVILISYQVTPIGRADMAVRNYVRLIRVTPGVRPTDSISPTDFIFVPEGL